MEDILKGMENRFGQLITLIWVFLHKLLPLNLTVAQVQELIKNKEHPFWTAFDEATKLLVSETVITEDGVLTLDDDTARQIGEWGIFYKKYFNLDLDLSGVKIPNRIEDFNRLIVIPKGLSINKAFAVCQQHFEHWEYSNDDLESIMRESERGPVKKTTARWFRDRVEADEEVKNKSANDLERECIKGITLLERIILELKYWSETGKHLDKENWTLCSGSRHSDGDIPCARWDDSDGFDVIWHGADYGDSDLRSRVAVG